MAQATAKSAKVTVGIDVAGPDAWHQPPDNTPRWTDRSPEERQRIVTTPITFTYSGGSRHAGSGVFESWLPGDRPGVKTASPGSNDDRFSDNRDDIKGDE